MSTGRPTAELMEDTIRDFNREAPGRRRNSNSTINAAAAIRRLEVGSFTAPLLEFREAMIDIYRTATVQATILQTIVRVEASDPTAYRGKSAGSPSPGIERDRSSRSCEPDPPGF